MKTYLSAVNKNKTKNKKRYNYPNYEIEKFLTLNTDNTKNKKHNTERLELKKYCPFDRKHTLHKETK